MHQISVGSGEDEYYCSAGWRIICNEIANTSPAIPQNEGSAIGMRFAQQIAGDEAATVTTAEVITATENSDNTATITPGVEASGREADAREAFFSAAK